MQDRIKTIDLELSQRAESIADLDGFLQVKALVRLHGTPLGYVDVPVCNGRCSGGSLRDAALARYGSKVVQQLLRSGLAAGCPESLTVESYEPAPPHAASITVTVAICTRNRVLDLARCLDSLAALRQAPFEILVVDNAPANDSTERLVRTSYPRVRYVSEPRPGLNWARNRAIMEASGEIVAFTDDDVVVDGEWLSALAAIFSANPDVMAVTGLVVPLELETKPQIFFETYGGCGRGFQRKWIRRDNEWGGDIHSAWRFGSGANMAYRRSLFSQIGYFDVALDVGTVANGGGDLEMFFRLLKGGHTLVYEPAAIVRHRHRRSYDQLRAQISSMGVGYFSYLVRSAMAHPAESVFFLRAGLRRMWRGNLLRLLDSFLHPSQIPRDLILVELVASLVGLVRYQKSRNAAVRIAHRMGSLTGSVPADPARNPEAIARMRRGIAVRNIDVSRPLAQITDIEDVDRVRLHICCADRYLGEVTIVNGGAPLSPSRISDAIVESLGNRLLNPSSCESEELKFATALAAVQKRYFDGHAEPQQQARLPDNVPVSVVVVADDCNEKLRACLRSLTEQRSSRSIEMIVVDTCPERGIVPAVVAEFANTRLVSESRRGSAYARNAGLIASTGDIVLLTHASMTMPPEWVERMLKPFVRRDVMVVTGNVLSAELKSEAAQLFDRYGGLGRGSDPVEADGTWFRRFRYSGVPAGVLGSAANAAVRAEVLAHPQIGLLEETLGSCPAAGAEESYMFYRVLQAGYAIVYEPSAYAWHQTPAEPAALRKQVYRTAQGRAAYHLTALTEHGDLGALLELALHWPRRWGGRVVRRLFGMSGPPFVLLALELAGWLSGAWHLLCSSRIVKKQGRSGFYIPVEQRSDELWDPLRSSRMSSRLAPEAT